jgi:hypothetical protein
MSSKLFIFNRDLPAPFDKLRSKTVAVSSTYGDGTNAKLTSTVAKAVLALCRIRRDEGQGALGKLDVKSICEYKSSEADKYHLAVHDMVSGNILASVYDANTETIEQYTVGNKARDGAALMMAILPALLEDEEFNQHFEAFYDHYGKGFTDVDAAAKDLAMLCDNAYRRISDDACTAHIKVNIDTSGNITRISQMQIDAGNFEPKAVLYGEFTVFAHSAATPKYEPVASIDHSDFMGKYPLSAGRALTMQEQTKIPALEAWYILPQQVVSVCKHAMASSAKNTPMRNFLLRGPAGTGKTAGARAIAAGLGLPYVLYTCSANTEIYDFVGQMFPDGDSATTGDAELDAERKELQRMGGVTYENVAKWLSRRTAATATSG